MANTDVPKTDPRAIFADWVVESIQKGDYSTLSFIPLYAASFVRALSGSWLRSQMAADVIIVTILTVCFILLAWRVLRSMCSVSFHCYSLCRETPTVILSVILLTVTGLLLTFIYTLSAAEFPEQHEMVTSTIAGVTMTLGGFLWRVGNAFRAPINPA